VAGKSSPNGMCASTDDQAVCAALTDLYKYTNGPGWRKNTNWLNGNSYCSGWYGVKCSKSGQVTSIELTSNRMRGMIPDSLGNLHELAELDLQSNSLNGTIPNELGNCTKLESLSLSNNRLTGNVPDDLSRCTYMRYLYLNNNGLTGDIPDSFGKFKYINTLDIQSNGLTGDIPESLGDLASLKRLALNRNAFNGYVPQSFCKILPNLYYCGLGWEKSPFKCPLPACMSGSSCGAVCQ